MSTSDRVHRRRGLPEDRFCPTSQLVRRSTEALDVGILEEAARLLEDFLVGERVGIGTVDAVLVIELHRVQRAPACREEFKGSVGAKKRCDRSAVVGARFSGNE